MNLLLVIDLQYDFINEISKSAPEDIKRLVDSNKYDKVLFTRYINNKNSLIYKRAKYEGCFDDSKEICIDTNGYDIIDKETYSAYNQELIDYIKNNNIENIYLCGISVDCCVFTTAMNLFENNYSVYVLSDYVYSTTSKQDKKNILEILIRNLGEESIL